MIGKRVQVAPWMDRWAKGDRFGTIIEDKGSSGIAFIYRIKMDKSGDCPLIADTNFTLV